MAIRLDGLEARAVDEGLKSLRVVACLLEVVDRGLRDAAPVAIAVGLDELAQLVGEVASESVDVVRIGRANGADPRGSDVHGLTPFGR